MKILLSLVSLLAAAVPAFAQARYPSRPGQGEFLRDGAQIIRKEDVFDIALVCERALAAKRAPIIVCTIRSLADQGAAGWTLERYAKDLFSEWGVGWPEWNHGMLIVVSPGDRKARIELGAGWGREKDAEAERLMNEIMVPHFRRGEFSQGILEGVKGLHALALGLPTPRAPARERARSGFGGIGTILIVVIVVAVVGSMLRGRGVGRAGYGYGGSGCSPFGMGCMGAMLGNMLFSGSSYGGSSGGSWGGGSFGGGFSGGGGATGSW